MRAVFGGLSIVRIVEFAHSNLSLGTANVITAGFGIVAAIALALGAWTRIAAFVLFVVQWRLAVVASSSAGSMAIAEIPALVYLIAPPAPFGSWAARGRVDPEGGWRLPGRLFELTWFVAALVGVIAATGIFFAMSRPGVLAEMVALSCLVFAALAFTRATQPFAWILHFIVLSIAFGLQDGITCDVICGLSTLSVLMLLFDPSWLPPRTAARPELVFFDGHCGLCHRLVRFVLAEDRERLFVFSTLQGERIKMVLDDATRARLPDSVVVQDSQGRVLVKSAAVVHVYDRLGGIWRVLSYVLRVIPTALRDLGYDLVAMVRHHLFARPADSCPLIPPALKDRFVA